MNSTMRVVLGIGVVVVAVVLLVVLKDDGDDSSSEHRRRRARPSPDGEAAIPTIVIKNGKPVGGIKRDLTYNEGEQVRFKVESDVSDEVHVHGYDIMKDVKAGGSVTFDFPATIEGIFEAELEGRKEQILELRGQSREPAPRPAARPRAGRAAGPADPGLALRLGGVDRPDRLLLRALGRLARAPLRERTLAPPRGGRSRGPCSACPRRSSAARSASSCSASPSTPALQGTEAPDRNFALTFLFVTVLARLPGPQRRLRQRLQALQPVAGDRPRRRRRLPGDRRPALRPPAPTPRRLGRWPAAVGPGRLRLAGDRLRRQRRRRRRRLAARGRRRRPRLQRLHAGDDGRSSGSRSGASGERSSRSTSGCSRGSASSGSATGRLGVRRPLSAATQLGDRARLGRRS